MTEESGRRGRRRVTLEDVARHAAVSRATVSIVMRDVPGVSSDTRRRVLSVARELGYRPDVRARALAGQTSRLIGVMFGVGVGSFHFDLLEGLYAAAEDHGLELILSALTRGRDERRALQSLSGFSFDALVVLGPATARPLLAGEVPIAVVGWHVSDTRVDVIRTSDNIGMSQAVTHLVRLGHRRITHIDGGPGLISQSRRDGYTQAMTAAGLGDAITVIPGGETQFDGQRAARSLLAQPDLPTAVITFNDDTAVAAMEHLTHHGVSIPGQLSVIGWDDGELARLSPIALTSVVQQPDVMARLAVERLIARIDQRGIDDHEIVLTPTLKVRETTAQIAESLS